MESDDQYMKSKRRTIIKNILALLFLIAFSAGSEPLPGNKLILKHGNFCRFFKINEKEYKLEWGKKNIRNISSRNFKSSEILKCNLVLETSEFTILKISESPGTRKSIILPLNRTSQEIQYQNALCVDPENRLIIIEKASQDSILIVENFSNGKKIVLGKDFIPCRSDSPHDCIDSLSFYDNDLLFHWITPDKQHKDKKVELKKFRINLK